MINDAEASGAHREYAAAHTAHYGEKDLDQALSLYLGITAAYPESREAGYARSQIQNITKAVASEQDLLDAHVNLVQAHLRGREPAV